MAVEAEQKLTLGVGGAVENETDGYGLAGAGLSGRGDAAEDDFLVVIVLEGQNVDGYTVGGGVAGGFDEGAGGLVAVAG